MPAKLSNRVLKLITLSSSCFVLLCSPLCNAEGLESQPFWQASIGFWASENTYMDGQYKPKIPHYQTLNAISVSGNTVTSEERKFYPPGAFAAGALGLDIPTDQGVQLIQVSHGKATADVARVDYPPLNVYSQNQQTWLEVVSDDSAIMTVAYKESGDVAYKMLITVPTDTSRITASLGINGHFSNGSDEFPLRGVSVFSAKRVSQADYETMTLKLQKQYHVGSIVTLDKNGNYQARPIN